MRKYIKPEVSFTEIELTSFMCVSIGEMNTLIEIDEYTNAGEEVLNLDSDY